MDRGLLNIGLAYPSETTLIAKFVGANMGTIWGRQDPGRPHFGPMNFAIWVTVNTNFAKHDTVVLCATFQDDWANGK